MTKYSFEFKKKLVNEYLNGEGSYQKISNKYGIKDKNPLRTWVNVYKGLGEEGLKRKQKNNNYSFEFKESVVKLYLSSKMSYQYVAIRKGMNNPSLVGRWVNDYLTAGIYGLKPRKRGIINNMSKPKKANKKVDSTNNVNSEYLKQLEEENLQLRIENAYLKELRRLRLEKKKTLRQRLES